MVVVDVYDPMFDTPAVDAQSRIPFALAASRRDSPQLHRAVDSNSLKRIAQSMYELLVENLAAPTPKIAIPAVHSIVWLLKSAILMG